MTGNDLSRLLHDGTPEPPRPLAADDLLRRARRRRAGLVGASSAVAALATVAAVAVAVQEPSASRAPVAVAPSPTSAPVPSATGTPGAWPDLATSAVTCAAEYPAGLGEHAVAFDGTVEAARLLPPLPGARFRPAAVEVRVHRMFAGAPRETVRLDTADFMLPSDPASIVGLRILAATGPELDLKGCGYSRPYSEADAGVWQRVFNKAKAGNPPDDCGIGTQRADPGSPDESHLVGMPVDVAIRDVENRGLTPRLIGDGVDGHTDDYQGDRVTMCNRDGVITAAARF